MQLETRCRVNGGKAPIVVVEGAVKQLTSLGAQAVTPLQHDVGADDLGDRL
jgi:hypothetical protein